MYFVDVAGNVGYLPVRFPLVLYDVKAEPYALNPKSQTLND